jgi:hypothetical protein
MSTSYPEYVDTSQLAALLAGGDDYIRTKNNVVRGLALKRTLNPDAPEVVVFGKGPRVVSRAKLFLESGLAVPAYIKRETNLWQFLGMYRANDIRADKAALLHYGRTRKPGSVAGALVLERVDEEVVRVHGGGFADSKTRSEIEVAAVEFVVSHLKSQGFAVTDCQRENRGYDFVAIGADRTLYIEVKGTDSSTPRFFITRNERKAALTEPGWRLYVVTAARATPQLFEYDWIGATTAFRMEALAWECTLGDA